MPTLPAAVMRRRSVGVAPVRQRMSPTSWRSRRLLVRSKSSLCWPSVDVSHDVSEKLKSSPILVHPPYATTTGQFHPRVDDARSRPLGDEWGLSWAARTQTAGGWREPPARRRLPSSVGQPGLAAHPIQLVVTA